MSAAIMVALNGLLVIGCLAAALFAPSDWFRSRSFGIGAIALFIFGIPILLRVAERSRIREAVRQMPGTVIALRRMPFWRQGWDYYCCRTVAPKYKVIYSDFADRHYQAVCRSGFLHGVEWLEVKPVP